MATTAKKASSSADHDKDLQTLMELQEKLGRTAGLHQMVVQQMQKAKLQQRREELSLEQLADLPVEVPVYKQVGKAYLMAPMQQLRDELKDNVSALSDELKRLDQQRTHAAKSVAATEAEVQELFKANPELTRQLMPAAS